ncbi:hypothetical protein P2G88_10895 [Aliiglaciecola sp. CAU 1673]|uniref:hypothetical protein n=1 Tax=Aliiglaciecola sp. CAU 1673 TaxID=3032595 RepID=UPI0023DC9000|nr:hypothetical protein [Aliiglaciecola sp. CAU 1673]MDF2178753.1 hypothetical protein [Aliiglaciecola sp. CAU 1673]
MALIDCPSCNKKISDKAAQCSHCGFGIGAATDDDMLRKRQMQKFKRSQSIQTQSMIAMLMFISGFGFMYWGDTSPGDLQYNIAIGCSVIGFIWYIINRIRLIFVKKSD